MHSSGPHKLIRISGDVQKGLSALTQALKWKAVLQQAPPKIPCPCGKEGCIRDVLVASLPPDSGTRMLLEATPFSEDPAALNLPALAIHAERAAYLELVALIKKNQEDHKKTKEG